jgi:enoyl-CoA hydratase
MHPKFEFFEIERRGAVAWVWLNRPQKRNAMSPSFWKESPSVFGGLAADPEVRCIVIAGKGPCFSAGIDLIGMMSEFPGIGTDEPPIGAVKAALLEKIAQAQEAMSCVERCKKPVIAAVHGYCLGAGVDLICACDIRLCAADATFSVREAAVAIAADVGTLQRLPHIVGQGVARELTFTACNIDAGRAKSVGLVNETYPTPEALFEAAQKMAELIAEQSPLAVQTSKEVLNFSRGRTVEDGLAYVAARSAIIVPSEDLMEAAASFAERRKPNFKGK